MTRAVDLDALRAIGEAESRYIDMLEGLCLNAIEVRRDILCHLSAEDSEWGLGKDLVRFAKLYSTLLKHARYIADNFEDPDFVVFAAMTKMAERAGQAVALPWA